MGTRHRVIHVLLQARDLNGLADLECCIIVEVRRVNTLRSVLWPE